MDTFTLAAIAPSTNARFAIEVSPEKTAKELADLFKNFAAYLKSASTGKAKLEDLRVVLECGEEKTAELPAAPAEPVETKAEPAAEPEVESEVEEPAPLAAPAVEAKPAEAKPAEESKVVDDRPERKHDGLSPSSFQLFSACNRKYFLKKIAKADIDPDASEDTEAFRIGKAFHKVLEVTQHNLSGFSLDKIRAIVCGEYELSEHDHLPMIFAMLVKYKKVHDKSKLNTVACELILDLPDFYGIVDAIKSDNKGNWWICDMKTASSYQPNLIPSLPSHPQLNLYAWKSREIAAARNLDPAKFMGVRYLLTTKTKLVRKASEGFTDYVSRAVNAIKSLDFAIPKEALRPELVIKTHKLASEYIKKTEEEAFSPNLGNCMSYHRPCEFWSRCHGNTFTETLEGGAGMSFLDADSSDE